MLEEGLGGAVDQENLSIEVERDHACGDRTQDRFDESPAGIELSVGGLERAGLLLQTAGHPVEGSREHSDFVFASLDRKTNGKIALLNPPGSIDECANRSDQPVRDAQRSHDREADDDQRAEQQGGVEPKLIGPASIDQRAVILENRVRALDLRFDLGIDHPGDVEIAVLADVELGQDCDPVGGAGIDEAGRPKSAEHPLDPLGVDHLVIAIDHGLGADDPVLADVEDRGFVEASPIDLKTESFEHCRGWQIAEVASDVARHCDRFLTDPRKLVFVDVVGDLDGVFEHPPSLV